MGWILCPSHRWGKCGSERLCDCLKITQLEVPETRSRDPKAQALSWYHPSCLFSSPPPTLLCFFRIGPCLSDPRWTPSCCLSSLLRTGVPCSQQPPARNPQLEPQAPVSLLQAFVWHLALFHASKHQALWLGTSSWVIPCWCHGH